MGTVFLILTSTIFPVLVISWLCCIAFCIYKSLLKHLKRPGRNTKIEVVVTDRRSSEIPTLDEAHNNNGRSIAIGDNLPYGITEVDVEGGLNQSYSSQSFLNGSHGSVLLSDAIKEARKMRHNQVTVQTQPKEKRKEMRPSEPFYYPQLPQSENVTVNDPMAPLQAPFPGLPPLDSRFTRRHSSAVLPTSVRNFIESQNR